MIKNFKKHWLSICLGFGNILIIIFLLIAYGPFTGFRDWWITTALGTGNHKYLARVLYSDNAINRAMERNRILDFDEDSDASRIVFDTSPKSQFSSIYEEQVLKRDPDNDLYKIVEIQGREFSGFMLVIYDPTRIELATSRHINRGGQQLTDLANDHDAIAAINASGFHRTHENVLIPTGTIIRRNRVESVGITSFMGGGLIGFNKDGVLVLSTQSGSQAIGNGVEYAMTWGPFLILNGVSANLRGNGGWGYANRTAIAQRQDGIVLFLVIDGRGSNGSRGASIKDLVELFEKYGAYNAANLDGGGSSAMTLNGELLNEPRGFSHVGERFIPNAWILK